MGDPCGTATFRHSGDLLANNFPSGLFDTLWVEKVSFRGTSGGSGHAIRTCLRMFSEGRPVWQKVMSEAPLGGHLWDFGSILGAFGSTLRTVGRPCGHMLPHGICNAISNDFVWEATSTAGCRRRGRSPSWRLRKTAFAFPDSDITMCF